MSYEITYDHIQDGAARLVAALEDVREYIGDDKKFNAVMAELKALDFTLEQARCALSFAGIRGLPAEAMWTLARAM